MPPLFFEDVLLHGHEGRSDHNSALSGVGIAGWEGRAFSQRIRKIVPFGGHELTQEYHGKGARQQHTRSKSLRGAREGNDAAAVSPDRS